MTGQILTVAILAAAVVVAVVYELVCRQDEKKDNQGENDD